MEKLALLSMVVSDILTPAVLPSAPKAHLVHIPGPGRGVPAPGGGSGHGGLGREEDEGLHEHPEHTTGGH